MPRAKMFLQCWRINQGALKLALKKYLSELQNLNLNVKVKQCSLIQQT